jgi:hypothetical protein
MLLRLHQRHRLAWLALNVAVIAAMALAFAIGASAMA